jgi:hypothetical protein
MSPDASTWRGNSENPFVRLGTQFGPFCHKVANNLSVHEPVRVPWLNCLYHTLRASRLGLGK